MICSPIRKPGAASSWAWPTPSCKRGELLEREWRFVRGFLRLNGHLRPCQGHQSHKAGQRWPADGRPGGPGAAENAWGRRAETRSSIRNPHRAAQGGRAVALVEWIIRDPEPSRPCPQPRRLSSTATPSAPPLPPLRNRSTGLIPRANDAFPRVVRAACNPVFRWEPRQGRCGFRPSADASFRRCSPGSAKRSGPPSGAPIDAPPRRGTANPSSNHCRPAEPHGPACRKYWLGTKPTASCCSPTWARSR